MKIYFWLIAITILLIWLIAEKVAETGYNNLCKTWCADKPHTVISDECFCMENEKTWIKYERQKD